MLVLWMGYATAVACLVVAAAALIERRVPHRRRWVAALALGVAFLVPVLRPLLAKLAPAEGSLDVAFGPMVPIVEAAGGLAEAAAASPLLVGLGSPLRVAWGAATGILLLVLCAGVVRLIQARRGWRRATLDGTEVLVSDGLGPAVVGLRRPEIVVPEWVFRLSAEERALVLAHEEEHRRRGDPALIAVAALFPLLMPWNPGLWWGFARLRHAVEADCDARVLARGLAGRVRYSRLLLDVGSRAVGAVPLGAGFGERASSLERRIRDMLERTRTGGWRGWAVRIGLAVALVVAACTLEVNINTGGGDEPATVPDVEVDAPNVDVERVVVPAPPEPRVEPPVPMVERRRVEPQPPLPQPEPQERDVKAGPTFTPFTVAPSILNRDEVIRAMEAEYPQLLRDAGIGGTVRLYFFINEEGRVEDLRIDRSSGHQALDEAAMRVGNVYRFSPALNKNVQVPVWVSFPISFQVR